MTDFALWVRGLRGPTVQVLRNRGPNASLNETEKALKIAGPFELSKLNESLSLDEVARWFPLPAQDVDNPRFDS